MFSVTVFFVKQTHRKLDYDEASIFSYWRVAQHRGEQSMQTHSDAELYGMNDDLRTESKLTEGHNASTQDRMEIKEKENLLLKKVKQGLHNTSLCIKNKV